MEGLLSSAKGMRGKINMVAVITAFFLSIMNIMTYNSCKNKTSMDQFEKESKTMWILSIIILILACLLFGYDLAVMFNLI